MSFLVGGANLGTAYGAIIIGTDAAVRNLNILGGALRASAVNAVNSGRDYAAAGIMIGTIGALAQKAFKDMIGTGMSFDKEIGAVNATLGDVSIPLMQQLREEALRIGRDTTFTANEAGQAMEILAKAGVTAENIVSGVAEAVTNLAAAVGTDLDTAGNLVANIMNTFSLKASESDAVVDALTAAMNESSASITDIKAGMRALGPVVEAMGGNYKDALAAVSAFTNFGLKGADVGVSLARGLDLAARPTDEARAKMEELGIAVFDLEGKFIGFPALFDMLQKQMGGLSDEERTAALSMIFGAEAADVMALAIAKGSDEFRRIRTEEDKAGTAANAMAKRLDNLAGDVEKARGTFETVSVEIFDEFNPALRKAVQGVDLLIHMFEKANPTIKLFTGLILAAGGAMASFAGAQLLFGSRIKAGFLALREMQFGLALIPTPLLVVIGLLAALGVAYRTNLFGFKDAVDSTVDSITKKIDDLKEAWKPVEHIWDFITGTHAQKKGHEQQHQSEAVFLETMVSQFRKLGLSAHNAGALVKFLKDVHGPFRVLQNDFHQGKRLGGEFFDIISGGKGSAKFARNARSFFGKEVGNNFADATFTIRHSIQDLRKEFKKDIGFDPLAWLQMDRILAFTSQKFRAFEHLIHDRVIPTVGKGLVFALKGVNIAIRGLILLVKGFGIALHVLGRLLTITLIDPLKIFAKLIRGDFRGALNEAISMFHDITDASRDLANWVLNIAAPTVRMWASDAWKWITDTAFPWLKGQVANLFDWTLDVAVPTVKGWLNTIGDTASGFWDWAKREFSGLVNIAGSILDWTIDIGVPGLTGWISEKASNLWGWLSEQYADFKGFTSDTISWFLDIAKPFVIGKVLDIKDDLWAFVTERFSGLKNLSGNITAWFLDVPLPFVTGDILGVKDDLWGFLVGRFASLKNLAGKIEAWFLDVPVPFVTGNVLDIVGDVWSWLTGLYPKLTEIVGSVKAWFLDVAKPFVTGDILDIVGDMWGWLKGLYPKVEQIAGSVLAWFLDVPTPGIPDTSGVISTAKDMWAWLLGLKPEMDKFTGKVSQWFLALPIPTLSQAATLVSDVINMIEGRLKGLHVRLIDWHLEVGKPDRQHIDIDLKGISDAVADAVHGIFVAPPGSSENAFKSGEETGNTLGEKFFGGLDKGAQAILHARGTIFSAMKGLFWDSGGQAGEGGPKEEARFSQIQGWVLGLAVGFGTAVHTGEWQDEIRRDSVDFWDFVQNQMSNPKSGFRLAIRNPTIILNGLVNGGLAVLNLLKRWVEVFIPDGLTIPFLKKWTIALGRPSIDFLGGGGSFFGDSVAVLGWVTDKLKGIASVKYTWTNGFSISFHAPSIGGIDFNSIWNAVWTALKNIGDLSFSWPNSWSVHFGIPFVDVPDVWPFNNDQKKKIEDAAQTSISGGAGGTNPQLFTSWSLPSDIETSGFADAKKNLNDIIGAKAGVDSFQTSIENFLKASTSTTTIDPLISGLGRLAATFQSQLPLALATAQLATRANMTGITTAIVVMQGQARSTMSSMAQDVQTKITTAFQSARGTVQSMTSQMSGFMRTFAANSRTYASQAGNDFKNGLSNALDLAKSSTSSAISQIQGILRSVDNGMFSAGQTAGHSIGDGIVQGLNDRLNAVSNAAGALSNAASGTFARNNEIGSPSKLYARLTQFIVDAIVLTLLGGRSSVSNAMVTLSSSMASTPFGGITNAASQSQAAPVTASGVGGNQYVYNIEKISLSEAEDLIKWGKFVNGLPGGRSTVLGGT